MGNPLELFENLSTPMKWLVGAAVAGIAVFAYLKIKSGGVSTSSSVSPTGAVSGSSGSNGAVDISSLLAGLGYDSSTGSANAAGGNVANTIGGASAANSQLPVAQAPSVAASGHYVTLANSEQLWQVASQNGYGSNPAALIWDPSNPWVGAATKPSYTTSLPAGTRIHIPG